MTSLNRRFLKGLAVAVVLLRFNLDEDSFHTPKPLKRCGQRFENLI